MAVTVWERSIGCRPESHDQRRAQHGHRCNAKPLHDAQVQRDLWTPLRITRTRQWEGGRYLTVVARLRAGITLLKAQDDLRAVANQAARERPRFNEGWG